MAVVEYSTLGELSDELDRLSAETRGVDFTVPLKRSKVAIVASIKENFASESSPDGAPWAPLKRPRSRKGKPKGKDKILRDKGILYASVAAANGSGHVEELTNTTLAMGTVIEYAGVHQRGGKHIPARPFLGFGQALIAKIELIFADWWEQQVGRFRPRG